MAKRKKKSKFKKSRPILLYGLLLVIAAAVVILILELTNTTHLFHKAANVSVPTAPITSLPKQPAVSTKTPSVSSTITQGVANDENGKVPSSGVPANPNDWAMSSSGDVVIKLPAKNTTFKSGDTLTGTSSVGDVKYRLIDNQVGVIAQGQLNVINNNFTATINFTPYGNGGQLDVYTTAANGSETNEVQISVNF